MAAHYIQTVTGPVDPASLNCILPHEHLSFGYPGVSPYRDHTCTLLPEGDLTDYSEEATAIFRTLLDLRSRGVDLIIDPTTIETGRDPLMMKHLAGMSGVAIVCATGFFKDDSNALALLKTWSHLADLEKALTVLFQRELDEGIAETGVKAGVIKTASSLGGPTALEAVIFRAAAKAAAASGVPVMTHSDLGTAASAQLDLLREGGLDPKCVIIGHMSHNRDHKELLRLVKQGATAAFDQFGIEGWAGIPSDDEKIDAILRLIDAGYEDRIVISHDMVYRWLDGRAEARRHDVIFTKVLPELRSRGISGAIIRKLIRDNICRVFLCASDNRKQ